jgi:hypothetical protein
MATWADCAGCGARGGQELKSGTSNQLGSFDMTADDWKNLYVEQNTEKSLQNLQVRPPAVPLTR